jgi:hypothetical protein
VFGFIFGMIVGGAAVYFYGRQIREYVDETTRGARDRAADTLHAAAEGLQTARERVDTAADAARQRIESAAEAARSSERGTSSHERRLG